MIYRGRISRIVDDEVYVQVSELAVDQDFGPMEMINASGYSIGDYVLVTQIEGAAEDLVIIGLLKETLQTVTPVVPVPTQDDSFLGGSSSGTFNWKTKAETKTALDIDDIETSVTTINGTVATATADITTLKNEVQPVSRGGTGITSWTAGNYVNASGATTLQQRTPAQVKSDLALNNVDNTTDLDKPISTATKAYVDALPSGVWGTAPLDKYGSDSTIGTPTYIDSAGKSRIRPMELTATQRSGVWTAVSPLGDFPIGTTVLQVTDTSGPADGWPGGTSGTVITTRRANESDSTACGQQWFHKTTASKNLYQILYRSGSGNPTAWGPWVTIHEDSGWINITFVDADWKAYGGIYQVPQYKVKDGTVKLRGLVQTVTARTGASITISSMFASIAPLYSSIHMAVSQPARTTGPASTGTAHTHPSFSGGSNFARIDIDSSGNLKFTADGVTTLAANGWISLDDISWDLD